jgi:hypothetical protein
MFCVERQGHFDSAFFCFCIVDETVEYRKLSIYLLKENCGVNLIGLPPISNIG